ncbi:MAG: hypothetical protein ACYDDC_07495, partial [Thermoplasmataceae archaeon]
MKITNKLIGITAVLIVILFMGMSMQPSVAAHSQNSNAISVKQQVEYSKYFNQRPVNAKQQVEYNRYFIPNPVNAIEQLSNAFMAWYINKENANPYIGGHISDFHMGSRQNVKALVSQFLKATPSAATLLKKITAEEKIKFNQENSINEKRIVNELKSGKINLKTTTLVVNNNETKSIIIPLSASPETTPGTYEMVTKNYFVITINYGFGSYSFNYGVQDFINVLYVGSAAQSYYNGISGQTSIDGIITAFIGLTMALASTPALAAISAILATAIYYLGVALAAAAVTWVVLSSIVTSGVQALYESTYANNNNGVKYIWTYIIDDYMYPQYVLGAFSGDKISFGGYLLNGNSNTFY